MASPPPKGKDKARFPVGAAGKRELRNVLKATTNPAKTIREFQESHSLNAMMAKSFGTVPTRQFKNTRNAGTQESLDTDSIMTFIHHLGVSQHEVHALISGALIKQLEEEIRKTTAQEPLLELLKSCWTYATTIPELQTVLVSVLKQLGPATPLPVLAKLVERNDNAELKHADIFRLLPNPLKRRCWEADWDTRVPLDAAISDPMQYLELVKPTFFYETVQPYLDEYLNNNVLQSSANRPFVATVSERRILTTQRRAQTKTTTTTGTATASLTSGKAIAHVRGLIGDMSSKSGAPSAAKLFYAVLSILMAKHGSVDKVFLGGANHLHCTLVADLLLSAGGPLPKAYTDVLTLARVLDESVQEGNLTDANLAKVQATLRLIFQAEPETSETTTTTTTPTKKNAQLDMPSTAVKRQLNRIITSGLSAMKEADPQQLFLNPVTDEIAFGYSNIIRKPMSIRTMEEKIDANEYNSVAAWQDDVNLMFENCISYNRGANGKWFRGEANRQLKVFRDEIFPQARRLYQNEIAKRNVEAPKRKLMDGPEISPLSAMTKKRKKEKEEYIPSTPALASMLLSDPFVVRIVLARVLRELRRSVMLASTLPASHSVVPSLLQLLHVAQWSKQICAVRGKKYFIPGSGLEEGEDPAAIVSHAVLRRYLPLLLRLLLEAELDKRIAPGGDLNQAAQSSSTSLQISALPVDTWDGNDQTQVAVALVEGALVQICQPGNSLAVTFQKFATALEHLSVQMLDERPFFVCLIQALLRFKTKLPKSVRDAVLTAWFQWLRHENSVTSAAHECLIELLNEWYGLGNVVLPRDSLLSFTKKAVETVDAHAKDDAHKFAAMWQSTSSIEFSPVKKQYERMLKLLPEASANTWKQEIGVANPTPTEGKNAQEDGKMQVEEDQMMEAEVEQG